MVGRFVEQQQVRALPDDQGQHQTRLFSTGEAAGLFADLIALETKAAQIIAQLLLQLLRRQARQVLQRRLIGAQKLQLMLGEVAELDAFGEADLPAYGLEFASQELNQRRFPGAVAAQQADTRPRHQIELDGVEDNTLAIAGADFLHLQQRVRQALRLAEAEVERVIHVRRGDELHPLQHFNTALRLLGFGGFGAEAIDIALQMRDTLLLAFVHRLLLSEPGGALHFKRTVVAGVLKHRLLFDVDNFVDDRIEEIAIVGDQDQRPRVALQPLLQPDHRIKVEVVSRFIEQQQIGAADQRLREVKAHTPAAGKIADRPLKLFIAKTQAVQQAGGAGADGPGVDGVQLAVDGGDGMAVVALVSLLERGFQLAIFTIAVNDIIDCRLRQGRGFLIHPGQLPVAGKGHTAAVSAYLVFQKR